MKRVSTGERPQPKVSYDTLFMISDRTCETMSWMTCETSVKKEDRKVISKVDVQSVISTTVKLKLVGGRILMTSGLLESLKTNNI